MLKGIAAVCLFALLVPLAAFTGDAPPPLPRSPKEIWEKTFPAEVSGLAVAAVTGEVVAHTNSMVYYFRGESKPVWTAGEGQDWKYIESLGISRDGSRVIFQTDVKPRSQTEAMTLTAHYLDGAGAELWQKPNPYRYLSLVLSPSGKYILAGEAFHPVLKFHDPQFNLLWEGSIQLWHLRFDPTEKYLVDGEGGRLYTPEGKQVWDFGPWTRVLSVSDGAGYIMTQYFRTVTAAQSLFLTGRAEMKKVELKGTGGCLSPDGSLAAYVSLEGKLSVFNTVDLLAGGPQTSPLMSVNFRKPWLIQIGRDNRTLLAMGAESDKRSLLLLLDLPEGRVAWKKEVDPSLRLAVATEDNREVTLRTEDPRALLSYRCY